MPYCITVGLQCEAITDSEGLRTCTLLVQSMLYYEAATGYSSHAIENPDNLTKKEANKSFTLLKERVQPWASTQTQEGGIRMQSNDYTHAVASVAASRRLCQTG
jgi:hypothetical protein